VTGVQTCALPIYTANYLVAVTSITCIAVLLSAGKLVPGRVLARG
jgi:molybdate transport system permease protein